MPDAIDRLREAVWDRGPVPAYHELIEERHRKEWPTLWAAIDEVLAQDAIDKISRIRP